MADLLWIDDEICVSYEQIVASDYGASDYAAVWL